jgi:Clp amino terminal domain, pathogenicity island component
MFERFTDRARRVVVPARALDSLGVTLEAARARIERTVGLGKRPPSGHIPFTPRAKKVLELALREALRLNHNYIGTEHILLGLLREGEGLAAETLVELGTDLDAVRDRTLELTSSEEGRESEHAPVRPAAARVLAPGTLPAPGLPPYGSTERPRLDRVVPLAREVELAGGARLVLLSLEVWSSWMTLRSSAFAAPGEAIIEPVARFQLTDDAGTSYQCTSAASSSGGGWLHQHQAVFQPGPPGGTSRLTLTAVAADGSELATVEIDLGGGLAAQTG